MGPTLSHLHLASRDHLVSQHFYEAYFGFRFDALFPREGQRAATILRAPSGFQIYLEGADSAALPTWFHFGFLVDSGVACRELFDRMQRDGVRIVRPFVTDPFHNYFCADPDGHLLQIYFDPHAA